MRAFEFTRARTLEEALNVGASTAETAFLAGGTTVVDLVKLDVMRPRRLIDINRLPYAGIERQPDGSLEIGALVRNSDLAWHRDVQRDFPILSAAILSGASAQIRNMATTAGNLMQRTRCPYFRDNLSACNKREPGTGCAARDGYNRMHAILGGSDACIATHPSDMCVALATLDAEIMVQGSGGERRIAIGDFHLLPGETPEREHALERGELITAVRLPALPAGSRQRYLKLRDRESFEFALASAAIVLWLERDRVADVRIALGGVATKPWRCPGAEESLRGAPVSAESFQRAAAIAVRDAQPRKHNAFKVSLVQQAIVRALTAAAASEIP